MSSLFVPSYTPPSGGGAPSGPAGGDLSGTYPDPSIANNAVTAAKVAADVATQAELDAAIAALGTYAAYTPDLTASVTNPTLGTGSTQSGLWVSIGQLAVVHFFIQFGSSGTGAGSGTYRIGLPFTVGASMPNLSAGAGQVFDSSLNDTFAVMLGAVAGQAYAEMYTAQSAASTFVTAAVPVPWAASDQLMGLIVCRKA